MNPHALAGNGFCHSARQNRPLIGAQNRPPCGGYWTEESSCSDPLGELVHAHVVDDEEVGPEVAGERGVFIAEGFFVDEVAHHLEDGAVERGAALLDGGVADGLGEMGLAGAWRPHEQHIAGIVEELAGRQFEELLARQ